MPCQGLPDVHGGGDGARSRAGEHRQAVSPPPRPHLDRTQVCTAGARAASGLGTGRCRRFPGPALHFPRPQLQTSCHVMLTPKHAAAGQ